MADLSDKGSSESEEISGGQTPDRVSSGGGHIKTCADCGTTKTPLWRGGPAGPKSLCNACGIRSRKKRSALLGLNKEDRKSKKSGQSQHNHSNNKSLSSNHGSNGSKLSDSIAMGRRFLGLPREMPFQRPRSASSAVAKQRNKLGEEEQAACLLMALSCGSVYA